MISKQSYYIMAIPSVILFFSCYRAIRDIIWSIAKCNISKRTLRTEEFKSIKTISMSYLSRYIRIFHKEYLFWMIFKSIYVSFESIWLVIYGCLPKFIDKFEIPFYINLLQTFVLSSIIVFQFDLNRNTKFDRYLLKKRPNCNSKLK